MSTAVTVIKPAEVARASDAFMPVFTIETALQRRQQMVDFVKQIMVDGTDFGKIPGSDKPVLLKPGAEKLSSFFGFSPSFDLIERIEDWTGEAHGGEPFFYYLYKCRLVKNDRVIGEGDGSCNSWESKYRYRWMNEETVPEAINKGKLLKRGGKQTLSEFGFSVEKAETTGQYAKPAEYWERFHAAIADGTARKAKKKTKAGKEYDAWEIDVDATQYRVPNPDVADVVNTCQKMAQKRSLIAATLIGVNASDYFSQDMEDFTPEAPMRSSHGEDEPPPPYHDPATGEVHDNQRPPRMSERMSPSEIPLYNQSVGLSTPPQQNTLEQQKALAQRRIAEEKAKKAAAEAAKPTQAPAMPEGLMKLFASMTSFDSTVKVFEGAKAQIEQLTGSDKPYYEILGHHAMIHGNDLRGKTAGQIKAAVRELFEYCAKVSQEPPPAEEQPAVNASVIDDSDLPPILRSSGAPLN